MKAILVPVEQHTSPAVFHAALAVARTFDSYVEGIASGPRVPDVIITDVGTLPILEPDTRRELATNARQQFEAWMVSQSVPPRPTNGDRPARPFWRRRASWGLIYW